ncbi:MAG TPA: hypothetical protein VJX94_16975 [Stellaceae bacterium]|nr:hypothetical protein [Stellaceae bacterium]
MLGWRRILPMHAPAAILGLPSDPVLRLAVMTGKRRVKAAIGDLAH